MERIGVVLLAMGGPQNLDEVEPYIAALLGDSDMVRLPLGPLWQRAFSRFVARRRAPRVRSRYALIGGCSPIHADTALMARRLQAHVGHTVAYAMRYTPPFAEDAVRALQSAGATRLVVIPLFPHDSFVSYRSALRHFARRAGNLLPWVAVPPHFDQPRYLEALVRQIESVWDRSGAGRASHLLFAAHSIPRRYTRDGDPYIGQIETTVRLVAARLTTVHESSLAYQSALGPARWHGPSLEEQLEVLVGRHVRRIVAVPLSFVTENLETLYDLDIAFRRRCADCGIEFARVPTPGLGETYIQALGDLVLSACARWR